MVPPLDVVVVLPVPVAVDLVSLGGGAAAPAAPAAAPVVVVVVPPRAKTLLSMSCTGEEAPVGGAFVVVVVVVVMVVGVVVVVVVGTVGGLLALPSCFFLRLESTTLVADDMTSKSPASSFVLIILGDRRLLEPSDEECEGDVVVSRGPKRVLVKREVFEKASSAAFFTSSS
jgi:hypothetical protein